MKMLILIAPVFIIPVSVVILKITDELGALKIDPTAEVLLALVAIMLYLLCYYVAIFILRRSLWESDQRTAQFLCISSLLAIFTINLLPRTDAVLGLLTRPFRNVPLSQGKPAPPPVPPGYIARWVSGKWQVEKK